MDVNVWIGWIIVGVVSGWIAGIALPTKAGLSLDSVVGVLGAVIGGGLFILMLNAPLSAAAGAWSLWTAFVGAVVFLGLIRLFVDPRPVK